MPSAPGGATNLTARLIAQKITETIGQPVVVDNRPGANNIIGAEAVATSGADGYTLLLAPRETFGINQHLYVSLPYDPLKSFAYIGVVTEAPMFLVVNPSLGVKTMSELVALARTKSPSYGSFGIGSLAHLNLEALAQRSGIKLVHVPYKGAAPVVKALIAGEVALGLVAAPSALGFIRDGRLRALAVGSDRRLDLLPEVPTMAESGFAADILIPGLFGLVAPAGTPQPIIARLNAEMKRALALPGVAERLIKSGLVPIGSTPEAMTSLVAADVARFGALVKAIGIKSE